MSMPKLILVLVGFLVIGLGLLYLRQQRMDLAYQSAKKHQELVRLQNELWHQQLEIATFTSPPVLQNLGK
jgi:hypothetical protein